MHKLTMCSINFAGTSSQYTLNSIYLAHNARSMNEVKVKVKDLAHKFKILILNDAQIETQKTCQICYVYQPVSQIDFIINIFVNYVNLNSKL